MSKPTVCAYSSTGDGAHSTPILFEHAYCINWVALSIRNASLWWRQDQGTCLASNVIITRPFRGIRQPTQSVCSTCLGCGAPQPRVLCRSVDPGVAGADSDTAGTLVARPARALLTLGPAGLFNCPRLPLSQGFDPEGYPQKPIASQRIQSTTVWVDPSSTGERANWAPSGTPERKGPCSREQGPLFFLKVAALLRQPERGEARIALAFDEQQH